MQNNVSVFVLLSFYFLVAKPGKGAAGGPVPTLLEEASFFFLAASGGAGALRFLLDTTDAVGSADSAAASGLTSSGTAASGCGFGLTLALLSATGACGIIAFSSSSSTTSAGGCIVFASLVELLVLFFDRRRTRSALDFAAVLTDGNTDGVAFLTLGEDFFCAPDGGERET